jgi:hypothetical protein
MKLSSPSFPVQPKDHMITWCNIPEDCHLYSNCCENLKSYNEGPNYPIWSPWLIRKCGWNCNITCQYVQHVPGH